MGEIIFITGTDTGVGKTFVAAEMTREARKSGARVAAVKPVCSGGRNDARKLRAAAGRVLSLDEVNPWHFRAPVAPVLAARAEKRRLTRAQVLAHIRKIARRFDLVVVEGAGGLLSPLGEDFDSRDLIAELDAEPVIVCPNKLGAINQVLLTLAALPKKFAARARVALVSQPKPDWASRTNRALLAERMDAKRIYEVPWRKRAAER